MRLFWKPEKNELLKAERGICFEDIEVALAMGGLVDIQKYKGRARIHQEHIILVVNIEGQLWAVPAVVEPDMIFFRIAYPIEMEGK